MTERKSSEHRIVFGPELDRFSPESGSVSVEDLDPKWAQLAEINFGENSKNRTKKIEQLWSRIQEKNLEHSARILIGKT